MVALEKISPIVEPSTRNDSFAEPEPSLIFIPDITGFTKFVQSTATRHSQHIISELLETLLDSNHLGLDIAELEGDAIVFYKYAQMPSLDALLFQAKRMFENFHQQLQKYAASGVCHCGSQKTPFDLSLKIIIHRGQLGFTTVKQYRKPHGFDMIVAHKLLKNSINEREYVLVTDSFEDEVFTVNAHGFNAGDFRKDKTFYQNIGEVSYRYASLSPLLGNTNRESVPGKCPMFVSR